MRTLDFDDHDTDLERFISAMRDHIASHAQATIAEVN